MSQENVDVVLRLYRHPNADLARWARDDSRWTVTREPGGAQFHPDFESVRVGAPGASRYRGWDGYRAFWLDWLARGRPTESRSMTRSRWAIESSCSSARSRRSQGATPRST